MTASPGPDVDEFADFEACDGCGAEWPRDELDDDWRCPDCAGDEEDDDA